MGPSDSDEPGGWCRVEPGGWVRRRRRAGRWTATAVEPVLALATKRSADANVPATRFARSAPRRDEGRSQSRRSVPRARDGALAAARIIASRVWTRGPEGGRAAAPRRRERHRRREKSADDSKPERSLESPDGVDSVLLCQRATTPRRRLLTVGFSTGSRGACCGTRASWRASPSARRNGSGGREPPRDEDEKPTPTNDVPVRAFDGAVPRGRSRVSARLRAGLGVLGGARVPRGRLLQLRARLTESPERFLRRAETRRKTRRREV